MDRKLKVFLTIADLGNLTRAAETLGIAQPALSKTLQSIEAEIGTALFERLPRGLSLTEAGREYLHYCRRIEHEYNAAIEAVGAVVNGHRSTFHVGAGILFHLKTVPQVFRVLASEFSNTTLHLTPGVHTKLVPHLNDQRLDAVMGRLAWDDDLPHLATIPLLDAEIGVVAHESHPIAKEASPLADPRRLAAHDWVSYQEETVSTKYFKDYFDRNNVPVPRVSVVSKSFMSGLELVTSGAYLMTGPLQLAETYAQLGLKVLPTAEPFSRFKTGIWVRQSSLRFPIVKRFIELACHRYNAPEPDLIRGG